MINFGFDYLGKIRTVNLYNKVKTSIKWKLVLKQIQTNAALVIGVAVKDILQLLSSERNGSLLTFPSRDKSV